MKNKINIFYFLGLLLLAVPMSCNSSSEENENIPDEKEYITLRILTYNIFHGEATNGDIDMDLFAEIINNESPDLVALQEVDKGVARSNSLDITSELSERTGLDGYFFKYRDYREGEFGAAILSKFPVVEIEELIGYTLPDRPPKVFPFVKVKIDEDIEIYFNSSHLSTTLEEAGEQAKQLVNYYTGKIKREPLIIAGDLNLKPDAKEMEVLLDEFLVSDRNLSFTSNTRGTLQRKIDYVLYPDTEDWEVVETKTICREDASDHCAVLAVLRFQKP